MTQQTEAQLLADALDDEFAQGRISNHTGRKAAEELRRLEAANAELIDVLHFYEEQARLCRLIHSEGDPGRNALAKDGGNKAREAIAKHGGAA